MQQIFTRIFFQKLIAFRILKLFSLNRLFRTSFISISVLLSLTSLHAQEKDTIGPATSVDPKLLEWKNAKIPKEYTIAEVNIAGIKHLDTAIVLSIAGLQPGDKFMHPGEDIFAKSIANLWRQKLFSNVQIYVTKLQDDRVSIEINVLERPRLGNFKFIGVSKSEAEDLTGKAGLVKQTIITENMRRNITEVTKKFYSDKGFQNVNIRIEEKPDPAFVNSNMLTIYVNKGTKVHINDVRFYGNNSVDELKLKKQMKGTKEMSRLTLHPDDEESPFGVKKSLSFRQYVDEWGFLSLSKTKRILDPYFRFKLFSAAKFDPKKYEDDKDKVLDYYNSLGYRDAQIIDQAKPVTKKGNVNVDLKVDEGRKYYFGNITWKGNAKYSDSILNVILGINKGDIYNIDILNKRLGRQLSQ